MSRTTQSTTSARASSCREQRLIRDGIRKEERARGEETVAIEGGINEWGGGHEITEERETVKKKGERDN